MKNRKLWQMLLLIFALVGFVPRGAEASFSADFSMGYESLTLGHGNNNSVKPGDPSGFRLAQGFQFRYGAFRNLRLFVESDLHFASWSAKKENGNIRVETQLNTVGLGLGTGISALIGTRWTGEVSLGGSFSPYSTLSYRAEIDGYEPLASNSGLSSLYQIAFAARAFFSIQKGMQLGLRLSSFTGGYDWKNPGTDETQKDTFSAFSLSLMFRYWLGDETKALADWSPPQKSKFSRLRKRKPRTASVGGPRDKSGQMALPNDFPKSQTKAPGMSQSKGPAKSQSKVPAMSQSKGPALSQSKGPALSQSKGPALSQSKGPALSQSKGPALSQSKGPAKRPPPPTGRIPAAKPSQRNPLPPG